MRNVPLTCFCFVTFCKKLCNDELTDPKPLKNIIVKVVKTLSNKIPFITSLAVSKPPILTHLSILIKEMQKLPGQQSTHLRKACKLYFSTENTETSSVLCDKCLVLLLPLSMERTHIFNLSTCQFSAQRKNRSMTSDYFPQQTIFKHTLE